MKSILVITTMIVIGACSADEPTSALRQQNRELIKYSSVDASTFEDLNLCPSDKKNLGIVAGYEVRNENDLVTKSTVKIYTSDRSFCTGVVIGPRHIVSAAHCFNKTTNKDDILLAYGLNSELMSNYKVENLYVHPKFNGIRYMGNLGYENKDFHDVAALVLDKDLEQFTPVSIIPSRLINQGQEVILAGYGSYMQKDTVAERALSRVSTTIGSVGMRFRDFQLTINEKGACFGDSGGPMYIKHPGKQCLVLAGTITGHSRGKQYKCENGGGTITDVSRYQGWLKCVYKKANHPLSHLEDDASQSECIQ